MKLSTLSMLDIALEHADRGRPVFPCWWPLPDGRCACKNAPCTDIGKHPLGKLVSNGLLAATLDRDRIYAWWGRYPQANVAIRTGAPAGFVVLDIDPGKGGDDTLAELERQHGPLPVTPEAITGSGGRHILFAHPGEKVKTAAAVAPGIDIRGDGGYIIAAGSLHRSGNRYAWDLERHPDDVPPAPLPSWLRSLVVEVPGRGTADAKRLDTAAALRGVPEGEREQTLFRLACKLRGADVPQDTAERLIVEAAAHCVPPFPSETARGKVVRAYATYAPRPDGTEHAATTPPRLVSAAALQRLDLPPVRWAVTNLLPEGLCLLAGRPKCGKSWLAYALAVAVASGGMALGNVPVEAGDALYLALEDNQRRLQARLNQMLDDAPAPDRLDLSTTWPGLDGDALPLLAAWLDTHPDARLIVIDTLAKVRPARQRADSMYDSDYAALAGLQRLALDRHVAVVVVHHTRKADAEDIFDTVSGSLALNGAADAIAILRRDASSGTGRLAIRGRDIEDVELSLSFDPARALWRIVGAGEAHAARLVAALRAAGGAATRWDVQRNYHFTAFDLDAALTAAGDQVRTVERPRRDGRGGRPAQWIELTHAVSDVSDVSKDSAAHSGSARPNVAKDGANVAQNRANVARPEVPPHSGTTPNVANVANYTDPVQSSETSTNGKVGIAFGVGKIDRGRLQELLDKGVSMQDAREGARVDELASLPADADEVLI